MTPGQDTVAAPAPHKRRREIHHATERALDTWAAQKRLTLGGDEGFAPYSIIHKIRKEREGAGEGRRFEQKWLEVYWGDGYQVQLITTELPELPRMIIACYYIFRGKWFVHIDDQVNRIGCTKHAYWDELRVAQMAVETCLRVLPRFVARADLCPPEKGAISGVVSD